ncbi:MAG: S41 family peptidase [Polyangiaceae bacterium]|nr:S41 family peptidase [Polyangiaceae bacterium]
MAFRAPALPWLLAASLVPAAAAATPARESPYDVVEQLARVLVLIEHDYVEPVDRRRLGDGAIKGMVAALDPHSAYLPPDDYAIFQSDTEGRFGGIGVEVDFADGAVTVIAPIEGSPAERAGVRPGDRIIAIGNVPVRGKSSDELVRSMRGAPGTTVLITVRREGDAKLKYFRLTREIIEVASISEKLLEQNIGYIRIKQFQSGTHTELLDAIARLRKASGGPLAGVLLDMRNNPGGLVSEATAVADEMLDRGVLFTTRHRDRVVDTVSASRGGALRRGPLVVLVNEYSASAAELVAGALQDHRRATIVGTKTFGKGSVQSILDLPGGAGLRLTSMRYYTPSGRAIQAHGVDPDVRVEAGVLPDRSFGVIREADLDNHLPAESSSTDPSTSTEESSTHLGVARDVPKDPTGGSDVALSVAFQIATGVLLRR